MQVTLKKASELSRAALAAAKAIEPKGTIIVSPFSTEQVVDLVHVGLVQFASSLDRVLALIDASFELRGAVGDANSRSGVGALLTKVAALDEHISRITALTATASEYDASVSTDDMSAATRAVEQLRKDAGDAETRRFGGKSEIRINIIAAPERTDYTDMIASLKRRRVQFKDEITALNFANTVTLTAATEALLRNEKIID